MKYKKIQNDDQYNEYCEIHEELTFKNYKSNKDEIELIQILIEEYENRTISHPSKLSPVQIIQYLIEENKITKSQLARDLSVSRQLITDIINYRRGLSKSMILKLSDRFKMNTSAFNRPYKLRGIKSKGKPVEQPS